VKLANSIRVFSSSLNNKPTATTTTTPPKSLAHQTLSFPHEKLDHKLKHICLQKLLMHKVRTSQKAHESIWKREVKVTVNCRLA
jgi:hypothetical protein